MVKRPQKAVRYKWLKRRFLKQKQENSSDEHLFADENPKVNNRNDPALDRKESRTKQSHADT